MRFERAARNDGKEGHMRRKLTTVTMLAAMLVIAPRYATPVHATMATGFAGQTIVQGTFGDIDVFNHIVPPDAWKKHIGSDVWLSWQKTKGDSDLFDQFNTWQAGGTTGWHSHPGHSLIIVTSAT